MKKGFCLFVLMLGFCASAWAAEPLVKIQKAHIDVRNKASLQRGARIYMNYCAGCHSLGLMRYESMGKGIGLVGKDGELAKELLQDNLIFSSDTLFSPMKTALPMADAKHWFGNPPPDLSVISRVRGADWLFTYLKSFYTDKSRPWGVNNLAFPNVGMPNVLAHLQGIQDPVYKSVDPDNPESAAKRPENVENIELIGAGSMSSEQFDETVRDLVAFLAYVGEPHQAERVDLGKWVMVFLLVFAVLTYLLKKEYWRDVH